MNTAAAVEDRPAVHLDAAKLDPDVLATVIDETARRVEARAARPSPVHLRSWEEIERFADKAARSGMVPKDYIGKPDAIAIAVQMGSELGLAPVQSVQNIAVINGRPAIWGDALPGLCRASGMCKSIREWSEGEGDSHTYYCEAIRRDQPDPIIAHFSVADAKRAKLWQESPTVKRRGRDGSTYEADSGPWYSYPDRMLQMRARGFALRDAFPDVLKGLLSAEEARDIPWEDTGLSIVPPVATAAPIRAAAAPMPRAARVAERAPAYEAPKPHPQMPSGPVDPNPVDASTAPEKRTWAQWAAALEIAAKDARTPEERGLLLAKAEVTEIVRLARLGQYSPAKARIIELYEEVENQYLSDPPDPPAPEGEELPEIVGEEKIAAG